MNIYKTMLLTIIEPVVTDDPLGITLLRDIAEGMEKSTEYYEAQVGKMLDRVLNFIEMSTAVAQEQNGKAKESVA